MRDACRGHRGSIGRFFLHMSKGQPNRASIGTTVTAIGAILLTCAIAVLVYGLFTAH